MSTSTEMFAEVRALHAEARKADAAYSAALEAVYKKNAGDMRYKPDLQPEHIRVLRDLYVEAAQKWGPLYLDACRIHREEQRTQVPSANA